MTEITKDDMNNIQKLMRENYDIKIGFENRKDGSTYIFKIDPEEG